MYLISFVAISAAIWLGLHIAAPPTWLLVCSSLVAVGIAVKNHHRYAVASLASLLAVSLIILSRTIAVKPPVNNPSQLPPHKVTLSGWVNGNPTDRNDSLIVTIDHVITDQAVYWPGQVQIKTPLYTNVRYGDSIRVTGSFKPADSQDSYGQYLINHHVFGTVSWPHITNLNQNHANPILATVYGLQDLCQQSVIRYLPKDESGLLLGIVLGIQQPLSQPFNDALKATSTSHIIVASGYNATIIIATVLKLTSQFRRRTSISIALALLLFYVALSGFNPSIIRAAIMASIAILAQVVGRQKQALQLLWLTAAVMLAINPLWLFDISFQLSFAATLGVILVQPIIARALCRWPLWLQEPVTTTIAAQAFTFPVIAVTFGSISVFGMVANLAVLWLVPWVMLIGAIIIPTILIFGQLGPIAAWVVEPSLWYIKHAILTSAKLPLASVNIQPQPWLMVLYYALLLVCIWRMPRHETQA